MDGSTGIHLSLIIAALAVFVGPLIFRSIAKQHMEATLAVAKKQIIAPFREAWISHLRDLIAELNSNALHYHVAGFEDRTDEEYRRLTLLEHQIALECPHPVPPTVGVPLVMMVVAALEEGAWPQTGGGLAVFA